MPTAASMANPGGSPWITFSCWLGFERLQAYQKVFYETRHLIAADWQKLSRLTTYYLNRDWRHFDKALEDLLPLEHRDLSVKLKRDHHLHFLYELLFGRLWAVSSPPYYLKMKVAFNTLWSPSNPNLGALVQFASTESETDFFKAVQRDLFDQIAVTCVQLARCFPGCSPTCYPMSTKPKSTGCGSSETNTSCCEISTSRVLRLATRRFGG
jgi:hypothetical protein